MDIEQRLQQWLEQRQTLLVRLCDIHQSKTQRTLIPSIKKRDELFESLLDYICAGHFEVFQHILAKIEHKACIEKTVTQVILTKIQISTDLSVVLNDKYQHLKKVNKKAWHKDISQLAETLAERFELEDFLLENSYAAPTLDSRLA